MHCPDTRPPLRPGNRRLPAAALALLLAAVAAPRAAFAQDSADPAAGSLHLTADRFELEDGSYGVADRGVLFVPQDRSAPDGGVFGIVFHRFPARDKPDAAAPPVFILRGGPGFGGLELEEPGYYEENVAPFTAFTDVVVVGQRGFGPSRPDTECEGVEGSFSDPTVPEEERAEALREASRKCRDFWRDRGLALEGVNVREAATDVADVADALGYDRIVLSGGSFGSHWAMAVLRYHPELVERALLSGTEGPNHTYDMPSGVLNALARVAEDAGSAPEFAPWIPEGGLIEALRSTIDRVAAEPPTVTVEHPETGEEREVEVTPEALRSVADGYSSVPDSLHGMAAWPADVLRLHAGRFAEVARRALPDGGGWSRLPNAAFFLLDCSSGITEARAEELFDDPATEVVGPTAWFYRTACPVWDVDMGDDFRTGFRTEVPTVVVHGNWDLSTPYENALEIMPSFVNGKLVTVNRGTHGALGEAMRASKSFREAVLRFLRTGETAGLPERVDLPPVDWVVPAELPPASRSGTY